MTPSTSNIPAGLCQCGCGLNTKIIRRSDTYSTTRGKVRRVVGAPAEYIVGHANRVTPTIEDAQPFKIDGVYCRLIPLTNGQWAIVDAEDYPRVMAWKWSARWNKWTRSYYAVRTERSGAKRQTILMHRFIIDAKSTHVDHENGISLDNRRKNLRPATRSQNRRNCGPTRLNKSGYKGVHRLSPPSKPWVAKINHKLIGYFRTAIEAARAVDRESVRQYGEFAWLNFPKDRRNHEKALLESNRGA